MRLKISSRLFSDERGSVTPLVAIVLASVVILNFVIFDALRIKTTFSETKRMQALGAYSLLSMFDRDLEERYGIYCLRGDEKDVFENRLREILKQGDSKIKIMDFDLKNFSLELDKNLGDLDCLKNEIKDLMKYKSVTNASEKIVEKLKMVLSASRQSDGFALAGDLEAYVEIMDAKKELLDFLINGSENVTNLCVNGYMDSSFHKLVSGFSERTSDIEFEVFAVGLRTYADVLQQTLETVAELESIKSEASEFYEKVKAKRDRGEIETTERLENAFSEVKTKVLNYDFRGVATVVEKNYGLINRMINVYNKYTERVAESEDGRDPENEAIYKVFIECDNAYEIVTYNPEAGTGKLIPGSDPNVNEVNINKAAKEFFSKCRCSIPENIYKELPSKNNNGKNSSLADFLDGMTDITGIVEDMIESVKTGYEVNDYVATYFYDVSEPKNLNEHFLNGEVEYIMFGNREDEKNISAVYTEMLALRTILNVAYLFTDKEKMEIIDAAAAAMAAVTYEIGQPIFKGIIILAWATAEAANDMTILQSGKKVPLVKTAKDWKLSIEGAMLETEENKKEGITDMSYSDYLELLLTLVPQNTKLKRIQDLIELNMYKKTNKYTKVDELYTGVSVSSAYSFRTFAIVDKNGKHTYSWEQKTKTKYS